MPAETVLDSSLCIIGLVTLIAESSRGIVFPVLWPLCQKLNGSTIDYGYLVGIFSVGRVVVASRYGMISDKHGHKAALTIAFSILVLGASLWCNTAFINSLPALYIAQFVLGLGTGVLGVVRSYVVEQVAPAKRTYILARLSATQYAGFSVTPLLGMLLLLIGRTLSTDWSYMMPGYFFLVLSVVCLLLIVFKFKDIPREKSYYHVEPTTVKNNEKSVSTADKIESGTAAMEMEIYSPIHSNPPAPTATMMLSINQTTDTSLTKPTTTTASSTTASEASRCINNRVFVLMLMLNFTTRGGLAVYETEGAQVLLNTFNMQEWQLGLLISGAGVIGTMHLLFLKQFWTNRFSDFTLLIGGLGLFGLTQLIVMSWDSGTNASLIQYCFAMYIVYGFVYPVANSAALGVFAKIQKDGRQATAQGYMASMGSIARATLPILTGYLNKYCGYSSAFAVTLILMMGSLVAVTLLRMEILTVTETNSCAPNSQSPAHTDRSLVDDADDSKSYAMVNNVIYSKARSDSSSVTNSIADVQQHKSSSTTDPAIVAVATLPTLLTKLYTTSLMDKYVLFAACMLSVCAVWSIVGW